MLASDFDKSVAAVRELVLRMEGWNIDALDEHAPLLYHDFKRLQTACQINRRRERSLARVEELLTAIRPHVLNDIAFEPGDSLPGSSISVNGGPTIVLLNSQRCRLLARLADWARAALHEHRPSSPPPHILCGWQAGAWAWTFAMLLTDRDHIRHSLISALLDELCGQSPQEHLSQSSGCSNVDIVNLDADVSSIEPHHISRFQSWLHDPRSVKILYTESTSSALALADTAEFTAHYAVENIPVLSDEFYPEEVRTLVRHLAGHSLAMKEGGRLMSDEASEYLIHGIVRRDGVRDLGSAVADACATLRSCGGRLDLVEIAQKLTGASGDVQQGEPLNQDQVRTSMRELNACLHVIIRHTVGRQLSINSTEARRCDLASELHRCNVLAKSEPFSSLARLGLEDFAEASLELRKTPESARSPDLALVKTLSSLEFDSNARYRLDPHAWVRVLDFVHTLLFPGSRRSSARAGLSERRAIRQHAELSLLFHG